MNTGVYADKFATFLDVSGKVLLRIRFASEPYTLYNRLNASRLARFRKTRKHVNRCKTQC